MRSSLRPTDGRAARFDSEKSWVASDIPSLPVYRVKSAGRATPREQGHNAPDHGSVREDGDRYVHPATYTCTRRHRAKRKGHRGTTLRSAAACDDRTEDRQRPCRRQQRVPQTMGPLRARPGTHTRSGSPERRFAIRPQRHTARSECMQSAGPGHREGEVWTTSS